MPANPNIPATIATTKNINAHLSIAPPREFSFQSEPAESMTLDYLLDRNRVFFECPVDRLPSCLPVFCLDTFLPFASSLLLSPRRRPILGAAFTLAATLPSVDPIVRATLRSNSFSFPTKSPAGFVFTYVASSE
jgi:hypothetical protein